ncbi:MAG: ferrous iron transport protein A [Richelia sp. RM2_1_2]|nr:ferrous iron transport protein A [Richelia sp. SM2_1_7]NJM20608.1 ferrous iron transport protein A [Richelia sp. SM1_7_0]NJN09094.1 ferrous iron transport protein A [Richelia sp. RM1_1_1]NJO28761.1 ferrous iron transport protein A [Richelia sp. SL_2_1]NJO62445.1 ferrous iron transport protein A [Richelia sp. RM2_1_2]NJS16571.1 ferrous iron transport protein A [Nostocaceae cyanobacterium CSU_2_110]
MELSSLKVGETAVILELSGEPSLQQRLLALGFRPGKRIKILRKAWLNGPLHIKIGTTEVMVRRRDTSAIKVIID